MSATWLVSLAEMSNFCSICTVLFCFIIMVIFIIRLRNEQIIEAPVLQPGIQVPLTPMITVQNPFVFSIETEECNVSPDAFWCVLSSQESCLMHIFWGVSIPALFSEIGMPWQQNKERLQRKEFLADGCLFMDSALYFESCAAQRIQLKYPDSFKMDLESIPRRRYPLVTLITISFEDNERLEEIEDSARIIALISIVHLKDNLCPLKSGIYAQYLKRADGWVCPLKPLFMATESSFQEDNSLCPSPTALYQQSEEMDKKDCVVCQNAAIMRVLLPCRHACVCDSCFTYLDKCPICRGYINSYFRIGHLQANDIEENHLLQQERPSLVTRWQRWNEQLNEWLGFN